MRFLYFSFIVNVMRLNNRMPTMGTQLTEDGGLLRGVVVR